jgi:hypothetical protein
MGSEAGPYLRQVVAPTSARNCATLAALVGRIGLEYRRVAVGRQVVGTGAGPSCIPSVAPGDTCKGRWPSACRGDRRVDYTHCNSGWSWLTIAQTHQKLVKYQLL